MSSAVVEGGRTLDAERGLEAEGEPREPSFLCKYVFSTDHKTIAIQFLFTSLFMIAIGGALAMGIRWQLAWPDDLPYGDRFPESIVKTSTKETAAGEKVTVSVMNGDTFTMLTTMHGTIMIFFVMLPLLTGTFGNFLIPLQIGARGMAFPRLNLLSFWLVPVAALLMLASFLVPGGAAAGGWTNYPPVAGPAEDQTSAHPAAGVPASDVPPYDFMNFVSDEKDVPGRPRKVMGAAAALLVALAGARFLLSKRARTSPGASKAPNYILNALLVLLVPIALLVLVVSAIEHGPAALRSGHTLWTVSLFIVGMSGVLGAVNHLTTIVKLRAPGMTPFRMPLATWSLAVTSVLVLLSTPVLASTLLMLTLDRVAGTSFFRPMYGGQPLLWQHLFWFYAHPAAYIMILPVMGMISDVLSTFARKPLFGYHAMVYALAGIGGLGFLAWGQHMFQSGMNPWLGMTFMIPAMMIALPSAVKVYGWIATCWKSRMRLTVPMLYALAFVSMFIVGGLSGIVMAAAPVDIFLHDTYFVVGHIHYVLFGGSLFGVFAAVTFWFPKMFGRMMNRAAGYIHFVLTFLFFNWTFFPMHLVGMAMHPRRIAVAWDSVNSIGYRYLADIQPINEFMTYGALMLGATQILFLGNVIASALWGKKAEANPWQANTLEWCAAPSPPPPGNWGPALPAVYRGPYEYASPLVEEDYLPQNRKLQGDPGDCGAPSPRHEPPEVS
ncbi:MAG: cbb3-type cytochrome c oxidase subunit I [Planctomycetes bacterium]|nr:cbb3-type cytochrome c oxidase subunit I [Planctomycetota bacterium]